MKISLITILIIVILSHGLIACGHAGLASPAESSCNVSNAAQPVLATTSSAIDSTNSAQERRALIPTYQESGDLESAYLAAKKVIVSVFPQGSRVYFALPCDDYTIYKMRVDGTGMTNKTL